MALSWLSSMLQTTDPLFPIGSYAHSYGLEELAAAGDVTTAADLLDYLSSTVALNLKEFELPYLRFAYQAWQRNDSPELCQLDAEFDAAKLSKELRNASATQGAQRLRLIHILRPSERTEMLKRLKRDKKVVPHHFLIFAAENVDLGAPLEAALAAWAYQTLAAPCTASLKLIRIGQEGAQTVLTKALQNIDALVQSSLQIERDYAGAFLPALDIASHRHERAYARLFIS